MKEKSKRMVHLLPGVLEIRPLVTPALTSNSPFLYANRREDVAGALSHIPEQFTFSTRNIVN